MLGSDISWSSLILAYSLDDFDGNVQRDGYNVLEYDQTRAERQLWATTKQGDLQKDDDRVEVDVLGSPSSNLVVIRTTSKRNVISVYTSQSSLSTIKIETYVVEQQSDTES